MHLCLDIDGIHLEWLSVPESFGESDPPRKEIRVLVSKTLPFVFVSGCIYTHTHTHVSIHVCVYIHIYIHTRVYVYIYTHTCIHVSMCVCTQTLSTCAQSCPTVCDPVNCRPPGFSVHGIRQAKILEWEAVSFSRVSSQLRDETQVSCVAGRFFTIWATLN